MGCLLLPLSPSSCTVHVQAVDSMLLLVEALAQQWMGVWLRPKAPSDDWLLLGLRAHLVNVFIGRYLGRNELLFRQALHLNNRLSRLLDDATSL